MIWFSIIALLATTTSSEPEVDIAQGDPSMVPDARLLLNQTITAIGGFEALEATKTVVYSSKNVFKSRTLSQSYNLKYGAQSVSAAGAQRLAFNISSSSLQTRIDREYVYGDYWIFVKPTLQPPVNTTLVIQDGLDGYACFTKGNNFIIGDTDKTLGYVDSYLTDYLIHYSHQYALPWLLQAMTREAADLQSYTVVEPITNNRLSAIESKKLGLSLLLNEKSRLPYKIRSFENHPTFGSTTSDLLLSNYSAVAVSGTPHRLLLPQQLQTLYGSEVILEEFRADSIAINPILDSNFFLPTADAEVLSSRQPPIQSVEYPRAEVHEFFEAGMWLGPANLSISDIVVEYPLPGINEIMAVYVGQRNYVQLVLNFTDGLLVVDAAAHQSRIILEWAKQTFNKPITHIVPSHHHHDHALGVVDYVAAGATLVIPEVARDYYRNVNGGNVNFALHSEDSPFSLRDERIQFRSYWRDSNPHARDWTYSVAARACPKKKDGDVVVAHIADAWNPGPTKNSTGPTFDFDHWSARQWLDNAVRDGIPKSTIVVAAHGPQDFLSALADITGYQYPDTDIDQFTGSELC